MPSKYMSERLARVPFRQPPPSQNSLHHEFLADIDFARANTISGLGQEGRAWQQLATNALSRVASKEAKAYVWNQFAQAPCSSAGMVIEQCTFRGRYFGGKNKRGGTNQYHEGFVPARGRP